MDWNELEWTGMDWNELEWTGMDWNGLEWTGMDWNGLEWTGMNWTTLEYTRLKQKEKTLLDIPVDSSGIHLNPPGIGRAHESTASVEVLEQQEVVAPHQEKSSEP